MTVKKAIKILDWWIENKRQATKNLCRKWNYDSPDKASGIAKQIFEMGRISISNLEIIQKELIPNCNHPPKMRDRDPNGQWYCMSCNLDL